MIHKSVLLHEAIEGLALSPGDIVVDATLGSGGHSEAILKQESNVKIIGIDLDNAALERSKERLDNDRRVTFVSGSYRDLSQILESLSIVNVQKVLFDFGFSSDQIETSGRGFSFLRDEPLLMTFTEDSKGITAYEIVNTWDEDSLRGVLRTFGEERFAGRIARALIKAREKKPIGTTFDLVDIIRTATPVAYQHRKIHPATKTFQALRIAVNDELETIRDGIESAFRALSSGGRIAAISFHSHEDRIVKHTFKTWAQTGSARVITKKPITPRDSEREENPRARSAKLRIIEKI